jgi:hypothetical protein
MESPTNSNIFRPSPEQGIERVRPDAVEFAYVKKMGAAGTWT